MSVSELGIVYARGRAPAGVEALAGAPRGRMLAVRGLDQGMPSEAIRRFASAAFFPWGGKSFRGRGEIGSGINRVWLLGRRELFPFATVIQPSVIDARPCVALDYDLGENPGFIRAIHDEVREVAPGLFLGPAMWKTKDGPRLVLWFALDANQT